MPLPNFNTDHNKPTGGWPQFSETASGWEAIERHVIKHDTAEMRDYAEDIDTLLVFAGLFSAILTGFIVQTYPMLTEDDSVTTNQLLALSVSARLRATSTIVPSTMNSTLFSLLDTAPFVPSTAVRSINILFFLSLIFSLAAALFGILAKQWLREYLKWNSALPSARENVLVRQVRIEAWEAWNVAATISSIPALLELAMVLFLTGIVVLLWTLDDIVAKVVTVFAVLFLLVASAFTVLPIFFTRCPYKSPTAWACVSAYYAITIIPAYCFAIVKYHRHLLFRSWQRFYRPILAIHMRETWVRCAATWPTSWREWDLQSCRDISPKLDGKSFDRNEVRKAVCKILSEMSPCPSQLEQVAADAVLKDISETSYLVRALSWVQQSSQDPRTLDFVKQCIESIHPEPPSALSTFDFIDAAVNVVATRCVLLALQENLLTHSHSALLHGSESALCLLRPFPGEWPIRPFHVSHIHGQMLVADLRRVVARGDTLAPAAAELSAILQHVTISKSWNYHEGGRAVLRDKTCTWYQEALHAMIQVQFPPQYQDVRLSVFQEALRQGRLVVTPSKTLELHDGESTAADYEALLLRYFVENLRVDSTSDEYLVMIFGAAIGWLERETSFGDITSAKAILEKTTTTIEEFLNRLIYNRIRRIDIAFRFEHRDLKFLLERLYRRHSDLSRLNTTEFRLLMHAFEIAFYKLSVPSIWAMLHYILQTAHAEVTTCENPTCRWLSHSCSGSAATDFNECPFRKDDPYRIPMSAPLNAIQLSPTTALTRAASGAALGDDTRRTLHDSVASVVLPPLAGSAILESTDGADESAPVIQECEDDVVALREMPGIGASGRERLEP